MFEGINEWLFHQYWRINKARSIISLVFWISAFVGIWSPLIQDYLQAQNIHILKWQLILVLGILSMIFSLIVGIIFDKYKLWLVETEFNTQKSYVAVQPLEKEAKYVYPLLLEMSKRLETQKENDKLTKKRKAMEKWLSTYKEVRK